MRVLFLIFASIVIGHSHGGLILHNIRDNLHSKLYGHGLHGENTNQNSPIININNHQQVAQPSLTHSNFNNGYSQHHESYGFQQSSGGHNRGDHGSLSNYGPYSSYGGKASGFMNTNIKAGGVKYGYGGAMGDYGSHSSMKQESYHHREGPKFGQHHDTNMFGNTKIGTSSSSASSSSSSSGGMSSSSAASSAAASLGGSSTAAASSSSSSSSVAVGGNRIQPWRYSKNHKF